MITPRCYPRALASVNEPATCLVEWQSAFGRGMVSEPTCDDCANLLLLADSNARRLELPDRDKELSEHAALSSLLDTPRGGAA